MEFKKKMIFLIYLHEGACAGENAECVLLRVRCEYLPGHLLLGVVGEGYLLGELLIDGRTRAESEAKVALEGLHQQREAADVHKSGHGGVEAVLVVNVQRNAITESGKLSIVNDSK